MAKKAAEKIKISWAKTSVGDILAAIDEDGVLCVEQLKYLRYGCDKATALKVLEKIPLHRETLRDICDDTNAPPEVVAQIGALVDNSHMEVKSALNRLSFKRDSAALLSKVRAKFSQSLPPDHELVD